MLANNLTIFAIVAVCLAVIHLGFDEGQRRQVKAMRWELDRFDEEGGAWVGGLSGFGRFFQVSRWSGFDCRSPIHLTNPA